MYTVAPSVSPRRTLIAAVVLITIFAVFAGPGRAATVRLIGEYSNLGTAVTEHSRGFDVTLWLQGASVIGLITYVNGEEAYSHTSLIRDAAITPGTGAIGFRAKLYLTEYRHAYGEWGRAVETVRFDGTLTETALVGRFSATERGENERAFFEDNVVILNRLASTGETSYDRYVDWLAANELRVGTREVTVAVAAESTALAGRALQVGLYGGILRTGGDDARFYNTGGGHFGLDVLYTVFSRFSFGARLGLSRFEPNSLAVGDAVIPSGVKQAQFQAPESGFLLELAPIARLSTGDVFADRTLFFVQAGAGYYYVNLETPYSAEWTEGAHLVTRNGNIGHVGNHFGASAAAGISIRISDFSRFEVVPEYHRTFGDGDLSLFGVMMHFRVEFLHDNPPSSGGR